MTLFAVLPVLQAAETEPIDPIARVAETRAHVAMVRGLDFDSPVPVRVLTPPEAIAAMRERLESGPAGRFEQATKMLKAFGLADPSFDYFDALSDSLEANVGGYYDPANGELVVVTRTEEDALSLDTVVRHELVHVLQDRHLDIRLQTQAVEDDDLARAFNCLMEGDASYTERWLAGPGHPGPLARTVPEIRDGALPLVEASGIASHYTLGPWFVQQLHDAGGWRAVDAAFADPPLSTEMVLHPEKRAGEAYDPPVRLRLRVGRRGGRPVYASNWGELGIALALTQRGIRDAWEVAAGWDGDWYVVVEHSAGLGAIWRTAWDSEADARAFATAAEQWFGAMDPRFVVDQRGSGVVVVVGVPRGKSAALVKRAWKAEPVEARSVKELLGRDLAP